ncbi:MAG TPA: glycosyltransferase family 4 protein [Candidatus Baltobacteraceae bacterium]
MQTIESALVPVARGTYLDEPLRVVHLLDTSDRDIPAWGKERAVEALMRVQRESGQVNPELVCFAWSQFAADLSADGFPVLILHEGRARAPHAAIAKLKRILGAGSVPVVHTHSHKANVLGRATRIVGARMQRLIASYHGWDQQVVRRGLLNRMDRSSSRLSDAITVPDAAMARLFGPDVRVIHLAQTIAYTPLPTDDERAESRAAYGFAPDDFVVGTFGRLNEMTGALELLAAARGSQARGITWAIAGSGELAGSFQISGLKNVRMLGEIEHPASFFAAIDVYVQAAHRENLGPSLLAAMRAGIPSVATRVGVTDIAARHDVEALIIEPGDSEDMLQRIAFLKRSPLVRRRLGASARTRFDTAFDIRFAHETLLDLYRYGGMKRV